MARVHERTEFSVSVVGCGRMGCAIAGEPGALRCATLRPMRLRPKHGCTSHLPSAATGEFVRRGCTVYLYDHTEYTRNRAFQTLRASLYDHVCRMLSQTALPRESRG